MAKNDPKTAADAAVTQSPDGPALATAADGSTASEGGAAAAGDTSAAVQGQADPHPEVTAAEHAEAAANPLPEADVPLMDSAPVATGVDLAALSLVGTMDGTGGLTLTRWKKTRGSVRRILNAQEEFEAAAAKFRDELNRQAFYADEAGNRVRDSELSVAVGNFVAICRAAVNEFAAEGDPIL